MQKKFKRIGTHDGRFHADEVMATAILMEIYDIELIRTRDSAVLDKLDIVYDVGGGEFDHHGVEKTYREDGIPFAATGLIWKNFGKQVIILKDSGLSEGEIDLIYQYIDRNLIEGMDALDNGIWIDKTEIPLMNVSSIISDFNPSWKSDDDENEAFNGAVQIASKILNNFLNHKLSVLKAKECVEQAFKKRKTKELLVLNKYCPYSGVLRDLDKSDEVLYVVYPRKDSYAIQTVRKEGREDKKKLPEAWAGKRDEELAAVTGVKDAVFCHTGRFIAVAGSQEGIMKMARLAIEEPEERNSSGIFKYLRKIIRYSK